MDPRTIVRMRGWTLQRPKEGVGSARGSKGETEVTVLYAWVGRLAAPRLAGGEQSGNARVHAFPQIESWLSAGTADTLVTDSSIRKIGALTSIQRMVIAAPITPWLGRGRSGPYVWSEDNCEGSREAQLRRPSRDDGDKV